MQGLASIKEKKLQFIFFIYYKYNHYPLSEVANEFLNVYCNGLTVALRVHNYVLSAFIIYFSTL